jgi:hypothetical protein
MRLSRFVVGLISVLTAAPSSADMSLSKYPKAYKGREGVMVVVVPLAPKEKNQALIKVSGVDTVIDGQVFLYDLGHEGRAEAYTMTWDGQRRTRLRMDQGDWGRGVTLYLPDRREEIGVSHNEEASKKIRGEDLLDTYLNRRPASDRGGKLNVPTARRQDDQRITEKKTKAEQACRATFALRVDWQTISEEQIRMLQISAYCGHVLDALVKVCADDLGRKAVGAKVKRIECRFGKAMKAQLGGGLLSWTTHEEGLNQSVYVKDFLLSNL